MSEVAATGDSFHSDRRAANQQRREHIALELKWSADKRLQDFGRSHRSNQASPPIYILLYTQLGGEVRFSTSIARRLASTGALNKGDQRANQIGGLERFNLESKEGRAALKIVYDRILAGFEVPGLPDARRALFDMGILSKSESGEQTIAEGKKQNIVRFFNRLLSLEVDRQNALLEYFYKIFTETVEHLKAVGKYDLGLEDIKAESVKIKREPQLIDRDKATGATTHPYELETVQATNPARFEDLEREDAYFYRKLGSEAAEFVAAGASLIHTDPETGESYQTYAVSRPSGRNLFYCTQKELNSRYRLVPKRAAEDWWNAEVARIPPFVKGQVFPLSGALIPVWRQIKNVRDAGTKIVRTRTDEGMRLVGLQIPKKTVKEIVRLFDCVWGERVALSRRKGFQIENPALLLLENYVWTGNFRELHNFVLKPATEFADAEVITFADVRALMAEKEIIAVQPEKFVDGPTVIPGDNQLVLEINPDEHLDEIIERVKQRYIFHHLKDKSYRRAAEYCGISRSVIRRIADKFESSFCQQQILMKWSIEDMPKILTHEEMKNLEPENLIRALKTVNYGIYGAGGAAELSAQNR